MKVSLNWLNEFVELPQKTAGLAELMTQAGVEVEEIHTRGVLIDNVVVAQILESNQHPNADRLSVCRVDDGSGQVRQIVCGAKNYKVGDKVPLALPGAVMPGENGGFKIKVGKLRGVESQGMMCSAKELGLAEDADGLLILPGESKLGTPLKEIFPAETVFELEVTPNRPDLLSHVGMAREIAALTGKPLRTPAISAAQISKETRPPAIQLEAAAEAPFYSARKISGVKVGPSPEWLRQRLEAIGIRSINNVVDVTNLVMMELGQPLHAFDAAKVQGSVVVRKAKAGEELLALDGKTYKLSAAELVIADDQKALAIAGIMGGESSGVTASTPDIILESAYFQSSGIRRVSRLLGLSSDSSYRFERGVDPGQVLSALERATALIVELCQTTGISEIAQAGIAPHKRSVVSLRAGRVAEVLGTELPPERIDAILAGFGLEKGSDGWRIPSFRQDLSREIDLIEEVTRVHGIDAIPGREAGRFAPVSQADKQHDRAMELRRRLASQGFYEVRTLTLISEKAASADFFPPIETRRVRNPLNEDQVVLRPNLLPGLLEVVASNVRLGNRDLRLFEIGRTFRAGEPEESVHLGMVLTGAADSTSWRQKAGRPLDLFDLKGQLSALGEISFEKCDSTALALAFEIKLNGMVVGKGGQLWPAQARALDLTTPVILAEIDLALLPLEPKTSKFQQIPRFPAVTRDIAMVAPQTTEHAQIEAILLGANEPLLAGVELFDLFVDPSGEKVAAGHRSLAYSLTYRSNERTLTLEEVNAAHTRLKELLKTQLPVQFRE